VEKNTNKERLIGRLLSMSVGFVFYSKFVLRICLYIVSNKSPVIVNSRLTHLRAEDLMERSVWPSSLIDTESYDLSFVISSFDPRKEVTNTKLNTVFLSQAYVSSLNVFRLIN